MNNKYLIQAGYVGNAVLWWAENCHGYTCDLDRAHRFELKEAVSTVRGCYEKGHKVWPERVAVAAVVRCVERMPPADEYKDPEVEAMRKDWRERERAAREQELADRQAGACPGCGDTVGVCECM